MNERDLFIQAIQIENPEKRQEFLHRACNGDSVLCERLETLLRAHEKGNSFLDHPPDAVLEVTVDAANDATTVVELPGTMIGRCKLVHEIGYGGMGVVYMAVQKSRSNARSP